MLSKSVKTRKRGRVQHTGRPLLPPSECYSLVKHQSSELSPVGGSKLGLIFGHLWTKVHQITSADVGETLFSDCRYLVPFRKYSRSKCKVVRNRAKIRFSAPIFWGRIPKFWPSFFLNCTHFQSCDKVSWRSAKRPRRSRAELKKEINSSKT